MRPDSEISLNWDERLALFVFGICLGGFIFSSSLQGWLSPPYRPTFPEPAMGFTHLLKARHGDVYGTYFEYLAATYGIWGMLGIGVIGVLSYFILKDRLPSPGSRPWQVPAGIVTSIPVYYVIWRITVFLARS
jgi:hypothetical protein